MASLQVGFGRMSITPQESVPLAGYGNNEKRMSVDVLDDLRVTCIAITDAQDKTLLLFSQDLISSYEEKAARAAVSEATGIPADHIMLAATHTHSAPDQLSKLECIARWKVYYVQQVVAAAQAALADRSFAEVYINRIKTVGLNFVRHYLLSDGSYGGDNFGDFQNNTIVDHAEPNDPQMQLIKFIRPAEGKRDIVMVNWQAHPTVTGGVTKTDMSADFPCSTRRYVESETGDLCIYFTGAAGNHNPKSRILSETPTTDYKEFGKELGTYVIAAQKNMVKLEPGQIKTTQKLYVGQINHEMENKLEQAKEVSALFAATDRATGNTLAREYGFSSVYHAGAVIRRKDYAQTCTMELNACSVGEISFIAAPYEMFAAHGSYIKDHTPFEMTFVMSCCNGSNSYLPTNLAFDYGCYESFTGNFVRGTGDDLAQNFVSMLEQQKQSLE